MFSNNLTMMTDLYELTMMQGYFFEGNEDKVVFDVFYRKNPSGSAYAITCGLDQVIDYIKNLSFSYEDIDYLRGLGIFKEDFLSYLAGFHFSGDIYAIPEGSVVFPKEPLVKVIAPIMEAQLVETAILNIINHQSLIATKASRVDYAAGGGVMEFGLRRAQGPDAGTRRKSCRYRWMYRDFQRTRRRTLRHSCTGNTCPQLDYELPRRTYCFPYLRENVSRCLHPFGRYLRHLKVWCSTCHSGI